MYELKTNTAVRIAVGPLVSPDDGFTAETSIDVTDLSVQIIRINQDGSGVSRTAFTPTASGGNNDMVHVASDDAGMYDLELTAAQLNFLGAARITFYAEDVCLPHWIDINVLSAAYYDFKYGSTAPGVNLTHIGGSAVNTSSAQLGVNVVQAAGTAWGSGAITAGSIASNAITDAKINNGAITADKIANNAIANAKIADNAITAGKIASDAITAAKIANNAITADKIASNAITDAKINNGAITADKIANNALANAKFADGAISVGKIADNAITAAKIAADAIGASELAADAASEIATAVWGAATRQLTNAQTFNLTGNITGNLSGSVGSVTGAVGSVTNGVTVSTNNDKTGYSLATAPPTAVAIRQEIDSNSTALAAIKGVTDKLDDTLEDDEGTYRFTEAALAEAPTGGSAPTAVAIRQEIDSNSTVLATIKGVTDKLDDTLEDDGDGTYRFTEESLAEAPVTSAADVWTNVTRTLTGTQSFNLTGNITGNLSGSVGSVTGAVGSVTGGVTVSTNNDKTGYSLTTAPPTAVQIRTEMDSNSTKLANLDAAVSTRLAAGSYIEPANSNIAAIKEVTDKLDDTLEDDGDGTYRFTEGALANAPVTTIEFGVDDIVDGVLDAALSDHEESGSVAAGIAAASNAGDPWATELPGSYGSGTAGKIIGDYVDASISSRLAGASYSAPPTASQIWSNETRTLTGSVTVGTNNDKTGYSLSNSQTFNLTGNITGNLSGSVGSVTNGVTVSTNNDKTGYSLSTAPPTVTQIRQEIEGGSYMLAAVKEVTDKIDTMLEEGEDEDYVFTEASLVNAPTGSGGGVGFNLQDIIDGVLDEKLSDHEEVGSVAAGIAAASSAGDPWATELPGSYGSGTAGKIIGDNIDAAITSRLSSAGYTAPPTTAQIWSNETRTLTAASDSSGVITLLSRVGESLSFSSGNVNVHVKAKDNIDFGALEKASLNAATPSVTVSDKTGFSLATAPPTAVEVRQEMDSNSTRLANLDATISSRMAETSYVAPPSVTAIRQEMDASSLKLANLDATVSSRLAADAYTTPPTATSIRQEMDSNSTKLANLDTTVSSRLASSSYTTPPTVTAIRQEIDANSSKLDVAISTRLAGDAYVEPDNQAIADIKEITDILDSMIEDSSGNRFTTKALEQTPVTELTVQEIIDGVLDEALLSHQIGGSVGAGISAAGSAGDPWSTILPGAYPIGTAGYVMGTNLLNPGTGSNVWLYRLVEETTQEPIVGALVLASSDIAGSIVMATAVTDSRGIVRFNLNSGTYYLWRSHVNFEFDDPDTEVVP
ncbi:MAG: hypothetical protein WAQ07_00720 [Candidatus Omnitrophota bacterium]